MKLVLLATLLLALAVVPAVAQPSSLFGTSRVVPSAQFLGDDGRHVVVVAGEWSHLLDVEAGKVVASAVLLDQGAALAYFETVIRTSGVDTELDVLSPVNVLSNQTVNIIAAHDRGHATALSSAIAQTIGLAAASVRREFKTTASGVAIPRTSLTVAAEEGLRQCEASAQEALETARMMDIVNGGVALDQDVRAPSLADDLLAWHLLGKGVRVQDLGQASDEFKRRASELQHDQDMHYEREMRRLMETDCAAEDPEFCSGRVDPLPVGPIELAVPIVGAAAAGASAASGKGATAVAAAASSAAAVAAGRKVLGEFGKFATTEAAATVVEEINRAASVIGECLASPDRVTGCFTSGSP